MGRETPRRVLLVGFNSSDSQAQLSIEVERMKLQSSGSQALACEVERMSGGRRKVVLVPKSIVGAAKLQPNASVCIREQDPALIYLFFVFLLRFYLISFQVFGLVPGWLEHSSWT